MDILRDNFQEKLKDLRETIDNAAFFVIDGEFTGMLTEKQISPYDTPEEYFNKYYEQSKGFILIQLGLTSFRFDEESNKFIYKTFNFYVYPRRSTFQCHGDSLSFLSATGFDFNKLFSNGVACCTIAESKKWQKDLEDRQKQRAAFLNETSPDISNHIPISENNSIWYNSIKEDIEKFLNSSEKNLIIENQNPFYRKLIFQLIESNFYEKISTSTISIDNNRKNILIERKRSKSEDLELEKQKVDAENIELDNSIGVSKIINWISESKKLVVGHNMLLDILFILRQCYGDVPKDYNEFKKFTNSIFPNLLDTKYLCSIEQFKPLIMSTVLSHVCETVAKPPFTLPNFDAESSKYSHAILTEKKEHNAGYDSLVTGICFLSLANYLKIDPKKLNENEKILKDIKNKIFCMRLQDTFYINLTGVESYKERNHVFYATFPSTWKPSDLIEHFRDFGSVSITWKDDISAFISLHYRDNAKYVLKSLKYVEGVEVLSFEQYRENLKNSNKNNQDILNEKSNQYITGIQSYMWIVILLISIFLFSIISYFKM